MTTEQTPNVHGFVIGYGGKPVYMLPTFHVAPCPVCGFGARRESCKPQTHRDQYHVPYGPLVHESCTTSPYECECSDCLDDQQREHEAEMYAEGAWLRAAENAIPQHELDHELAMEARDPGLCWMQEERQDAAYHEYRPAVD